MPIETLCRTAIFESSTRVARITSIPHGGLWLSNCRLEYAGSFAVPCADASENSGELLGERAAAADALALVVVERVGGERLALRIVRLA